MKTSLNKRLYTQLLLLLCTFLVTMPVIAHEMHGTAYYANSSLYIMWHDTMHAIGGFFSQMSSGYLAGLTILLSILGYIAIKVKNAERAMSV